MYVTRILIQQVLKLFVEKTEYRDDKYITIEYIVNTYYKNDYGKSIVVDFKLMSDIDRAFRYIQQHEPKLRGLHWLKRQRQGGEISKSEYEKLMDDEIENYVKQLKLF
jgi:hypothetical protein